MCRLRTLPGLEYNQIQDYMRNVQLEKFKKKVSESYLIKEGLVIQTDSGIKLDQYRGFIVSNSIIAELMSLLDDCIDER